MMEYVRTIVTIDELIKKVEYYVEREDIILNPKYIKSMNKISASMLDAFFATYTINIITSQISNFSHLRSSQIINVYPNESIYILAYVHKIYGTSTTDDNPKDIQPFIDLLQNEIELHIYREEADQLFKESHFLNLMTNLSILGDGIKMDINKIDNLYNIDKCKILGTKISPAGTFLQKQNSKFFKGKYNPDPENLIPIEDLQTNYLHASIDEIIVVQCPVCRTRRRRHFHNIKSLFTFTGNTVALSCSHPNTIDRYESKPYTFNIDSNLMKKYKKIELIMYIINNKAYYGLSINKKIS